MLPVGAENPSTQLMRWRLSVDLMPAEAPGRYQGVFATEQATAQMVALAVMTTLFIGWAPPGGSSWPACSRSRCFPRRRPRAGRCGRAEPCTLAGQSHDISPQATAPVLLDFLSS